MNLLLDQNISFRIVRKIRDKFPNAVQVREAGLEGCSDTEIWDFCKKNKYAIVTFDSDFFDFTVLRGHPPKVIWIRTGNRSTEALSELLISKHNLIEKFLNNEDWEDIGCIEIE